MSKIHGDPFHHVDYNAMLLAIKGDGVISGLTVTEKGTGANMSVDVAAGLCVVDNTRYRETGVANLTIEASESGKHRKDTVIYDTSAGNPAVIKGTSVIISSAAAPPDVTAGDILLAVVYVGDSVTEITDSVIYGGLVPVPARITDASSPTAADDTTLGYSIGDRWVNTTADQEFVCLDATVSAAVWIETTSQLQDDFLEIIRQMHPNVSVLAAMDDASLSDIYKSGDNYIIGVSGGDLSIFLDTGEDSVSCSTGWCGATKDDAAAYTLTQDRQGVWAHCDLKPYYTDDANGTWAYGSYRINSGSWIEIGKKFTSSSSDTYSSYSIYIGDLNSGDVIDFQLKVSMEGGNSPIGTSTAYGKNWELKSDTKTSGNALTDVLAANSAVLSFFSHLKGKFSNGASTATDPVEIEIFGDGDSYASALNATTKFKIDPTDPIIELYRVDDSEVAKSGAQTDWVLDDNSTNGAFPTKTTSTHETILGEEIGCASIVMVEKSVNGGFTDTLLLVEDDDYTIDYSTRTATKIILTTSAAADIVNAQSKLRITWIADVEDIEGTANTALKMKIYLSRTDTTEASPEIQPIDLGTGKYAEMKYMCG